MIMDPPRNGEGFVLFPNALSGKSKIFDSALGRGARGGGGTERGNLGIAGAGRI